MSKTSISIAVIVVLLLGGAIYFAGNSEPAQETASNVVSTVKETAGTATASSTPTASGTTTPADTSDSATVNVSVGTGKVKEFTVSGTSFSFSPETITVNKGDSVKITFKNSEGYHDLVIDGYDVSTKQINTGETGVVEFVADKAGEFKYYCSVGTHEEKGMKGTFIVR